MKITALQGDALDLFRFPDESFDTVFLYHLMNEESRIRAIREAKRVLKPGGYLFSSFILMFGGVIYGLRELQDTILWPEEQVLFDVAAKDESLAFEAFTYSWMTTVQDAEKLLASVPELHTETVFGYTVCGVPQSANAFSHRIQTADQHILRSYHHRRKHPGTLFRRDRIRNQPAWRIYLSL